MNRRLIFLSLIAFLVILIMALGSHFSTVTAQTGEKISPGQNNRSFMELLIMGGPVMIFIAGASILALAIFFERLFYLNKVRSDNNKLVGRVVDEIKTNDLAEASQLCDRSSDCLGAKVFKAALDKSKTTLSELKISTEETANREIPKLESKIQALGTIASIAPLLGLLGTVLGMIESLETFSRGAQDITILLSGIWTALITTAAGLIVAIPSLTAYNYLVHRVQHQITSVKNAVNEVLDILATK